VKKVFVCNDNFIGIFSAIYEAWKVRDGIRKPGIALRGSMDQELFCEYIEVQENEKKASAVRKLILQHLGEYTYHNIYHALLSHDRKKADAVLGVMMEARKIPSSTRIMEHVTHPDVQKVFELSRKVSNEAHFYREIVRFSELNNGVLYSEIEPRNCIITCLGDHFTNRFPLENWMIVDLTHDIAMVHEQKKQWVLLYDAKRNLNYQKTYVNAETMYEDLWKVFFESISIKERESYERQRQHVPLLYRDHMTEFQ